MTFNIICDNAKKGIKMKVTQDICLKFPTILKDKLLRSEIEFPDTTQFVYDKLLTYRAVTRTVEDNSEITLKDFKSYFELGKKPKNPRGVKNITTDPYYYGISSFLKKEIVEQKMKFPNPKKKMAVGYVHSAGGPQDTVDQHVCWWLYEGADISSFKLVKGEE